MEVRRDDPRRPAIARLLLEHLERMHVHSPPESVHALDLESLCAPEVTFWAAWEGEEVLGCGALLEIDPTHGEIKSMRTPRRHRRRGVASRILTEILAEADGRAYCRLSLETGSQPAFAAARAFYERFGFVECGPFGAYVVDPNSVFMTRRVRS